MNTTTTTPGAASELLPCPFCGSNARLVGYHYRDGKPNDVRCTNSVCTLRTWSTPVDEWNTRTPAPVMEGAQREAVAWIKEWDNIGDPNDRRRCVDFHPVLGSHMRNATVTPLYTAPPPPDRVQTERVEAVPKWAIDKAREYFEFDKDDGTLEQRIQERAVQYVRDLAAMTEPAPIAPPTDASGGVTEEPTWDELHSLFDEVYEREWDRAADADWNARLGSADQHATLAALQAVVSRVVKCERERTLEAADRARKPVDASAQAASAARVEVRPVVVQDCPDAKQVWLIRGNQSFQVGDYLENDEQAQWYAAQLRDVIAAPTPVAAYREPNINDIHAGDDSVFRDGPCPIDRELLDFLRSIGAVIRTDASIPPNGDPWDGVGAVKQPEPPRE